MANRNILKVSDPVWNNADHTQIKCMVLFEVTKDMPPVVAKALQNPVPFNAMKEDSEEHGQNLWNDLIVGKYGTIGEYVAPAPRQRLEVKIPGQ